METLLYIFSNAFRIYVFYDFSKVFFVKKRENINKYIILMGYIFFFSVNTLCELFYHTIFINILSNLLPFFFISTFYDERALRKLIGGVSIFGIGMFCDGVVFLVSQKLNFTSVVISSSMITVLFFFLCEMLIKNSVKKPNFITMPIAFSYYLSLFFIPTGSIVVGSLIITKLDFTSIVTAIFLFLLNGVVFYLYNGILHTYSEKYENKILRQSVESYRNEYKYLFESNTKIRVLKHDMLNHLNTILNFIEKGDIEKAKKHIISASNFIARKSQLA
ncbi:MAG: Spo0B domain-containing protein, partial [Oscillospiraceae bacterium]|nr:Spo0B domain-containing protein [Oscillospiraceae bacterium]